jgi:hypothetical protein
MDYHAKAILWDINQSFQPRQEIFPLDAASVFVGSTKVTTDGIDILQYWAHRHLAKERLLSMKILNKKAFKMMDWKIVYNTHKAVPKLFQMWACRQVMGVTGTMEWDKTVVCKFPSCLQERDTCAHVLF